jgi:hypothetical protein
MRRKERERLALDVLNGRLTLESIRAGGRLKEVELAALEREVEFMRRRSTPEGQLRSVLWAGAERAIIIEREPATGKQIAYLAALLAKHGVQAAGFRDTQFVLTKGKASRMITEELQEEGGRIT